MSVYSYHLLKITGYVPDDYKSKEQYGNTVEVQGSAHSREVFGPLQSLMTDEGNVFWAVIAYKPYQGGYVCDASYTNKDRAYAGVFASDETLEGAFTEIARRHLAMLDDDAHANDPQTLLEAARYEDDGGRVQTMKQGAD